VLEQKETSNPKSYVKEDNPMTTWNRMNKEVLFGSLLFFILLVFTSACADPVVINGPHPPDMIPLYDKPYGTQVALYSNGTVVDILSQDSGWSHVHIGDSIGFIEGYIENDFLTPGAPIAVYYIESGRTVGIISDSITNESTALFSSPLGEHSAIGYLPNGCKVELLGQVGEYAHVQIGVYSGFVYANDIQETNMLIQPDAWAGIPEIGYAILKPYYITDHSPPNLYALPSEDAMIRTDASWYGSSNDDGYGAASGTLYSVIADLGDWLQVRYRHHRDGFMKAEWLDTYMLDNMIITENFPKLESGRYTVGKRLPHGVYEISLSAEAVMPSGLYTYVLQPGETGTFNVRNPEGIPDIDYANIGPVSYTMFLEKDAAIEISGGVLCVTPNETLISEQMSSFEMDGRYFVSLQFPRVSDLTTTMGCLFTPKDEAAYGVVSVYFFPNTLISRRVLKPGEQLGLSSFSDIAPGHFIEMQDCTMSIDYSHN